MTARWRRKLGPLGAIVSAAAACLAVPTPAPASPITYTFSPDASVTFAGGKDTMSGSFTFDASRRVVNAADIVVSGAVLPNTYDLDAFAPSPFSIRVQSEEIGAVSMRLGFADHLVGEPDPIEGVVFRFEGHSRMGSASVTGDAVPVTASAPLLGSGLSGLAVALFLLTGRAKLRCRQA